MSLSENMVLCRKFGVVEGLSLLGKETGLNMQGCSPKYKGNEPDLLYKHTEIQGNKKSEESGSI